MSEQTVEQIETDVCETMERLAVQLSDAIGDPKELRIAIDTAILELEAASKRLEPHL